MPTPTEVAIAEALVVDGGARFRQLEEKWFPLIKDAYNAKKESGRRSHYGFSGAGEPCDRALWLRWRWMNEPEFARKAENLTLQQKLDAARMTRLVNRGHLEEARFMALLELLGVHVAEPVDGQDRVSALHGHAGSALDATMFNTPCIPNEWQLGEFKTMNDKHFKELLVKGVRVKKPEHFVQMQLCMLTRGIHKTLYMVVNKNDDTIYTEVVLFDEVFAQNAHTRMHRIIYADAAPPKIHGDPSWHQCKFCDCHALCHLKTYKPERSCRSCVAATPCADKAKWHCNAPAHYGELPDELIRVGCDSYIQMNT
jgi:hypothetical protein